jgi:HK97 family phage major capsid protein
MKNLIQEAKNIAAAAAAEGRALSADERATVEAAIAGAKAVKADAELRSAVESLGEELAAAKPEEKPAKSGRTVGQRLVSDPAFKSWLDAANAHGTPDAKALSTSPTVSVGGFKATLLGSDEDSAGALVVNDFYPATDVSYARELNLLGLITIGRTTSDAVEYARVMRFDEASGSDHDVAPGAEDEAASEATMKFSVATANVKDVRAFLPASVRALSDAAQLQTLADGFLRFSIQEGVTNQLVNGDGTGNNMTGLLNVSGVQSQAFSTDVVTTIRKAITKVRHTGNRIPNAVLLNPADAEGIDLLAGSVGSDYLFGGPAVPSSVRTIWGLPMVTDAQCPQGTAIVGDFRQAILWERAPLTVSVYPQHSDYAIKGLVAIVASTRAAFGVVSPGAFCVATID